MPPDYMLNAVTGPTRMLSKKTPIPSLGGSRDHHAGEAQEQNPSGYPERRRGWRGACGRSSNHSLQALPPAAAQELGRTLAAARLFGACTRGPRTALVPRRRFQPPPASSPPPALPAPRPLPLWGRRGIQGSAGDAKAAGMVELFYSLRGISLRWMRLASPRGIMAVHKGCLTVRV